MTSIAAQDHLQSRSQTRSRIDSTRTRILVAAALLAVAGVLFVWIVTGAGSGSLDPQAGRAKRGRARRGGVLRDGRTGQPDRRANEAARGQAVSTASGSVSNPGGPDEAARGQSVTSAASR